MSEIKSKRKSERRKNTERATQCKNKPLHSLLILRQLKGDPALGRVVKKEVYTRRA
jgi:hypothetical protein